MNKFAHVYPAMVTPMHEDGSFNLEAAKKHADWMISEDRRSGYPDGRRRVSEYVSGGAQGLHPGGCGGVSVIVGCSRERPEDVVELMENAREVASAAMVLPSFYYHPTQHEIYEHYKYINDHSGLDIMVYNNSNVTTGITTETMRELYKLEHVKIVKDASMMIDVMTDYIFAWRRGGGRRRRAVRLRLPAVSGLRHRRHRLDQHDRQHSAQAVHGVPQGYAGGEGLCQGPGHL